MAFSLRIEGIEPEPMSTYSCTLACTQYRMGTKDISHTCDPGRAGTACFASWDTSFQARAFRRTSFRLSSGRGAAEKRGPLPEGRLPKSALIASTTTRCSLSLQVECQQ